MVDEIRPFYIFFAFRMAIHCHQQGSVQQVGHSLHVLRVSKVYL